MRAFQVLCVCAASVPAALSWVAGCSSSIMPPLEVDNSSDAAPTKVVTVSEDAGGGADVQIDAGAQCTAAAAGGCSDVALCGQKIYVSGSSTTAPAAVGGTIAPGTYNLTGVNAYGVSGIANGLSTTYWFQQTFVISAALAGDAGTASDGAAGDADSDAGVIDAGPAPALLPFGQAYASYAESLTSFSGTLSAAGTTFALDYSTCAGDDSSGTYSANPDSFVLFIAQPSGGTLTETYTLQ
jgi:hypothetical protein